MGDARLVLIGEASHGTHEFYAWRDRLTRRLVAEKGFGFVAVEGDWPDCRHLHRYVTGTVQNDGSDGLIIGSHLVPWGLDEFVDRVVPLLQERSSLRAEYTGTTLRDNLGLPALPRASGRPA